MTRVRTHMLNERNLWLAATSVTIALLLLIIFQPPPERRDRTAPRFDEPGPRPAIWRTVSVVDGGAWRLTR
jgi:hypothetical protein